MAALMMSPDFNYMDGVCTLILSKCLVKDPKQSLGNFIKQIMMVLKFF